MIQTMNSNDIQIKAQNLEVMKKRIIELEKYNYKTKFKTNEDMLDEIRKIIMEEANKNY